MKYSKRDPRIKPRMKGQRELTGFRFMRREAPPLPPPLKEEMRTILVGGKEYQTLVKIYPAAEVVEDPNFAYPNSRRVPVVIES